MWHAREGLLLVLALSLSLSPLVRWWCHVIYIYLSLNTIECIRKYTPNSHTHIFLLFCFSGSGTDLFWFSLRLVFEIKTKQNRKHWFLCFVLFGCVSFFFFFFGFWIFSISWLKEIKEVHIDDNKQRQRHDDGDMGHWTNSNNFCFYCRCFIWGAHRHSRTIGFVSVCVGLSSTTKVYYFFEAKMQIMRAFIFKEIPQYGFEGSEPMSKQAPRETKTTFEFGIECKLTETL